MGRSLCFRLLEHSRYVYANLDYASVASRVCRKQSYVGASATPDGGINAMLPFDGIGKMVLIVPCISVPDCRPQEYLFEPCCMFAFS